MKKKEILKMLDIKDGDRVHLIKISGNKTYRINCGLSSHELYGHIAIAKKHLEDNLIKIIAPVINTDDIKLKVKTK